jgi:hypothetical protein
MVATVIIDLRISSSGEEWSFGAIDCRPRDAHRADADRERFTETSLSG